MEPKNYKTNMTSCAVIGCTNGAYKHNKWLEQACDIHQIKREICPCQPPFDLRNFPTKRWESKKRDVWKKVINREEENTKKLWSPRKSSQVCTAHFEGDLDYPTLNLGYDAESRLKNLLPAGAKRRLKSWWCMRFESHTNGS